MDLPGLGQPRHGVSLQYWRTALTKGVKFGDEMDLACAEFMFEDLWLRSLRVPNTPTGASDTEPAPAGLETVSPASLADLL